MKEDDIPVNRSVPFQAPVSVSTILSHPVQLYNLEGMTKVEMLSRIYQLERKDAFQTSRIQALTESLGSLRETVEGATTVMVSDAVIPVKNRYDVSLAVANVGFWKGGSRRRAKKGHELSRQLFSSRYNQNR